MSSDSESAIYSVIILDLDLPLLREFNGFIFIFRAF